MGIMWWRLLAVLVSCCVGLSTGFSSGASGAARVGPWARGTATAGTTHHQAHHGGLGVRPRGAAAAAGRDIFEAP